MKPIRVVMDADGVFVDFVGGVMQEAWILTGRHFVREQFPNWDIFAVFEKEVPGLKKKLHERIARPGFCAQLSPTPGAEAALAKLVSLEAGGLIELLIATSPWDESPTWVYERAKWFRHRGVDRNKILHTHVKGPIRADIFVDDKPSHITAWEAENMAGDAYAWATPHNAYDREVSHAHLDWLSSWDELFQAITRRGAPR